MPIYEYQCDKCGHELEVIQRMSDPPKTDCPSCNTDSLRKLVSAASFRLKGTGWYETDFKTKPEDKQKKPDAKPSDAKPSETKPSDTKKKEPSTSSADSKKAKTKKESKGNT